MRIDSELWTDIETLASAYDRRAYQSVTVGVDGKAGFKQLKAALDADPRLKLDVQTTQDYYSKQIRRPDHASSRCWAR